jgi:hypothetical protein
MTGLFEYFQADGLLVDDEEPTKMEVVESEPRKNLLKEIFTSSRMRLALMFTVSELVVIVSALIYMFVLFPLYTRLGNDTWKALWRLLAHSVWFEMTMILPQRVIAMKELRGTSVWRFLPIMHSLVIIPKA